MEVAGLVVGVFALVGVFEDCVTLLSQVGAAKSMAQDYTLIETKLDFQKLMLLDWAHRLNLFNRNYDRRLDNEHTRLMVDRGLHCIHKLLQDSSKLQNRYGIRVAGPNEEVALLPAVSDRLTERFLSDTRSLRQARRSEVQRNVHYEKRAHAYPVMAKLTWVIKDHEQFESLVRDISELVTDLNGILPAAMDHSTLRTLLKEEVRETHSVHVLNKIVHASTEDVELVDDAEVALAKQHSQLILNRLWFRLIDDRKNSINERHSRTFEWAIHPPNSPVKWSDLSKWLRTDHGIYWISGKPGSGKSTLMKFLYHHPSVKSMLQEWAGNRTLTVASFFLWNLGSTEQNTQQGLARGLLYHVLDQNHSLIPVVLPEMWREARNGSEQLELPSNGELSKAFQRLGAQSTTGAYAFFIDGLDEFAGDHREGIEFVQRFTGNTNVKLLLSSRFTDTCVAAFSLKPNLALQDLTKGDINAYIHDTIGLHPYLTNLGIIDANAIDRLLRDLNEKAKGVFLWVILACRTLLDGIAAFDNAKELQSRVEALPEELDKLFRHILGKIPSHYHPQTAKLLQICYRSQLLGLSDKVSTFALAWADGKEFELKSLKTFQTCSWEERRTKCLILEGRLRGRCMGLLEVHDTAVDFMHRTVFEFLNTPKIWEMDCLRIEQEDFDASVILSYMEAYLLYSQEEQLKISGDIVLQAVAYLQYLQEHRSFGLSDVLRCVVLGLLQDRKTRYPISTEGSVFIVISDADSSTDTEHFFGNDQERLPLHHAESLLAVESGLTNVVPGLDLKALKASQVQHNDSQCAPYPLLFHAIKQPLLRQMSAVRANPSVSMEVICMLLRSGCDPNEEFVGPADAPTTAWKTWLLEHFFTRNKYNSDRSPVRIRDARRIAEVTLSMIQAGARVDVISNPDLKAWLEELKLVFDSWLNKPANFWGSEEEPDERKGLVECCEGILQALWHVRTIDYGGYGAAM